jgi:hypothetical protein
MGFTERFRELRTCGHDRDVALGVLRRSGASFIDCVRSVREVERMSLRDAKLVVHQSHAWSDDRQAREAFWDSVIRAIESM